jgi:arylsulfatase A-like enzyme
MPLPVWRDDEFDAKPPELRAFQQNTNRGNGFGDYRLITHDLGKLRRFIAYYWGKVSMIDRLIGRVLAALDEIGERENTLILFTTDHGDFAGNHRLLFKSAFLYDDLVHVPLIASWPARWSDHAGSARNEVVEGIDLAPTMLRAAGLEVHQGVQGDDLAPVIEGTAEGWRTAAYAEAVDKRMLRSEEWKLVHYAGRPYGELYHLAEDPHELTNRWDDPDCLAVREELQRNLLDRIYEMEDRLHTPVRWLELPDPQAAADAPNVRLPFI